VRITYAGTSHLARTWALETGAVRPARFDLNYLTLSVPDAFGRMVRGLEFDASEMSLASFISLVAGGDRRLVGVPVFPARYFRHRQIYVRDGSGIDRPEALAGRRVGVPDYHQTAALWARAFLLHDYAVSPGSLVWVRGGLDRPGRFEQLGLVPPAGVRIEDAPDGRSLGELLVSGEIDAVVAPRAPAVFRPGSPVVRLFPDYEEVERDYFRRTGIFPIMHLVVLARARYEAARGLATALLEAFVESKRRGWALLEDAGVEPIADPWWSARAAEVRALFGGDPFPYGIERNRAVLEAALDYAVEQELVRVRPALADLFAPETLEHPGG
jgi:4,5-dihydroxyphthalate decarboxylase